MKGQHSLGLSAQVGRNTFPSILFLHVRYVETELYEPSKWSAQAFESKKSDPESTGPYVFIVMI